MQDTQLTRISNSIWSVTDDVLRDLYVRGKYRDVILPARAGIDRYFCQRTRQFFGFPRTRADRGM